MALKSLVLFPTKDIWLIQERLTDWVLKRNTTWLFVKGVFWELKKAKLPKHQKKVCKCKIFLKIKCLFSQFFFKHSFMTGNSLSILIVITCLNINRVIIYRKKCLGTVTFTDNSEEKSAKFSIVEMTLNRNDTSFPVQILL